MGIQGRGGKRRKLTCQGFLDHRWGLGGKRSPTEMDHLPLAKPRRLLNHSQALGNGGHPMSLFFHAGEAIGQAVRAYQPASQHNWTNIVPSKDWQMTSAVWQQMLNDIVTSFARLIAPKVLRPDSSFDGARTKELYKLQRRLADSVQ